MKKCSVQTPELALIYITDCNLATVEEMLARKSKRKCEFQRQISICQTAIGWIKDMNIVATGTRVREVMDHGGCVITWLNAQ